MLWSWLRNPRRKPRCRHDFINCEKLLNCNCCEASIESSRTMTSEARKKDVLQALVLTDEFTMSLNPLQKLYPTILMPVINVPLLDYIIETLMKSKVEEVFLYCSSHVDLLKEYIKKKNINDITISLIISDGCRCLGDALRDIYAKGCLRGNFILIRGDAFTNAHLNHLINTHRSTVKKDKGATLTMTLRNLGPTTNTPFDEETTLVVYDKATKKILHYEKLRDSEKKVKMKVSWFLNHDEVQVCTELFDTHVYMCSPSVLSLFADNFDFQTMDDFIRGVLLGDEILDSRIYWQEIAPEEYALAVPSWKIYHTLTKDVLCRQSYPLVPDSFPFSKDIICSMLNFAYKHKITTLSKGCILEKECFVGQNSVLGDNTTIRTSIIMDNCVIGSNVHLCDSYVFPNVKIEDHCTIKSSIIFPNCVIGSCSKIDASILCSVINVAANSEYTDVFVELSDQLSTKLSELNGIDGFYYFKSDNIVEDDVSSTESSIDTESNHCDSPDDTNMFLSEVIDSLLRGYQDKVKCENLILEINSSRYAYNVSVREVTYNVIKAILTLPLHYLIEINITINSKNYQKHLKTMLSYFHAIIQNYVKNEDAQDDCLRAIEDVASTIDELLSYMPHLLHNFYDRDVLSEEKILEWHKSEIDETDTYRKKVRNAVLPFIKWLNEAQEDSSESNDT